MEIIINNVKLNSIELNCNLNEEDSNDMGYAKLSTDPGTEDMKTPSRSGLGAQQERWRWSTIRQ